MPITYDIKTDLRYQQGLEQGESKKTRLVIERMLLAGKFSLAEIAEIAAVSVDYVIAVHNELNEKEAGGKH